MLKILILILTIFICFTAVMYDINTQPEGIKTSKSYTEMFEKKNSDQAPKFSIKTLDDIDLSLNEMKEDIILLNFWATWCAPCLKEFPSMIELVDKNQGKVGLLAISIDDEITKIPLFHKKLENLMKKKLSTKHIYWAWDEGKKISKEKFGTVNVPETIIIDKNRNMVKKIIGIIDWKSPEAIAMIKALINDSDI